MTEAKRNTAFAELIRSRMVALDMTFRDVAAASGLSPGYVYKLAKGDKPRLPNRDVADKLAIGLGLPAETFITAGMADMQIGEFILEEGESRSIYLESRKLSPQDRQFVLNTIQVLRSRAPIT